MAISAIECEKTILGGLLLENRYFELAMNCLCPKDFYSEAHAEIYEEMIKLFQKHKYVDVAILGDALNANDKDRMYLYQLANECVSTANLEAHMNIVREKSVQRMLADTIKKNPLHLVKFEGKIMSLPLCGSQPKKDCRLGNFFIELGHEINATKLTPEYLVQTLYEVSKAVLDTVQELEDEGEE